MKKRKRLSDSSYSDDSDSRDRTVKKLILDDQDPGIVISQDKEECKK